MRSLRETLSAIAERWDNVPKRGKQAVAVGVLVFVIALPFFSSAGGSFNDNATKALAYAVMALGLNIVVGYAGLLDLGYVAFYALGAYTVGWFASSQFHGLDLHIGPIAPDRQAGIHLGLWLLLPLSGLVAAFAGVIIGWPTLRLRGDYLAIVTLGFGEIIP